MKNEANSLSQKVHDLAEKHQRQKRWRRVAAAMSCIVVFCTFYALVLPTITMTRDTYCNREEHLHSADCYEQVLTCGTEETEDAESTPVHTDTEACYEETLMCQMEEHEHSLTCYSNPEADVENASVWKSSLPQTLGDNWAENVVLIAQSQIGYMESTANYEVDENDNIHGYTRYGAWFDNPYGDWSAMFASFCLHYAGVPQTSVPYASDCVYWVEQLQNAGLYEHAAECSPESGSLVFFDKDRDSLADHVGIVTGGADGKPSKLLRATSTAWLWRAIIQNRTKASSAIAYCPKTRMCRETMQPPMQPFRTIRSCLQRCSRTMWWTAANSRVPRAMT